MADRATTAATTRRRLGDAAIELFTARGFDDVTVDEVAARAGVSRRTAFRHAPTKADLALGHHPEWVEAMNKGLSECPNGSLIERLRAGAAQVCAAIEADPKRILAAMWLGLKHTEVRARVGELDQEWGALVAEVVITDSAFDAEEAALISGMVMGMLTAALFAWAKDGGDGGLRHRIDRGFDFVEAGIGGP